jgi:diacylglycerol kinase (ATP)
LKERILFIVNPISGGQIKTFLPSLVDKYLDHDKFNAEIVFSERIGHAAILAEQAIKDGFDIIASVGGDGTINEIGSVLVSSGKKMAIIPSGSGNGLARTLNIPLDKAKAIQSLNALKCVIIDSGTFNEKKFFNMAGMGFDAHISALFANHKKRGFGGYISTTLKEIKNYKAEKYSINIDGVTIERKAFMISIANSSQYGNNAHISPKALLDDGYFDVCIIKPFPIYAFPLVGFRMFNKTAHLSKYVEIFKGKDIQIIRENSGPIHIDGEPYLFPKEIAIKMKHLSLSLIA